LLLFLDPDLGSGIRNGPKNQDPQHCRELSHSLLQEFQRVHEELGQFADLQRHLARLQLPAQLAELRFSALVNPFPQAVCLFRSGMMYSVYIFTARGGGGGGLWLM
jgi:hypothetical protein